MFKKTYNTFYFTFVLLNINTLLTVIDHVNYHASILFLTAMSVDRCLATTYLMATRVYRTRNNATRCSWAIWLVAVATGVPFMLYSKMRDGKCQVEFPSSARDFESESELEDFIQRISNNTDFEYESLEGSVNKSS